MIAIRSICQHYADKVQIIQIDTGSINCDINAVSIAMFIECLQDSVIYTALIIYN